MNSFDPVRFLIHFMVGAGTGAYLGLMSWRYRPLGDLPWSHVLIGALIGGWAAGYWGNRSDGKRRRTSDRGESDPSSG
ncbi:MAG: hypothetical protein KY468_18900 [Armatimonadetes bacterium]|nr:hypothetical protein [Armatimonadota bacterium]